MFKNFSILKRMLIGFGITIFLTVVLYALSTETLISSSNTFSTYLEQSQTANYQIFQFYDKITNFRLKSLIYKQQGKITPQNINEIKSSLNDTLNEAISYIEDNKAVFDAINLDTNSIIEDLKKYNEYNIKFADEIIKPNPNPNIIADMENNQKEIGNKVFGNVASAQEKSFELFKKVDTVLSNSIIGKNVIISVVFVIIILVGIITALIISKSILKSIKKLKISISEVSQGNFNVNLPLDSKDEIGDLAKSVAIVINNLNNITKDIETISKNYSNGDISGRIQENNYNGDFKEITKAINSLINCSTEDIKYIVSEVQHIAKGNFSSKIIEFSGEKVYITNELKAIQNSIKNISEDIISLIQNGTDGNLEYRLDTEKYIGEWQKITNDLNFFVENIIDPIKETQLALQEFSKGNFSYKITKEYKGEFNKIKETFNFTAENINSYISEISNVLTQMSNKNFNIGIDRDYIGDFESIKNSVNLITENLNVLITDIIDSAQRVSLGAKQISDSSMSLAEGATEQAESVEELNNTIHTISAQIVENTNNSNKANELANRTKEDASKGNEQMEQMLISMEAINTASNSISNIIKVIDDIAFQTNILALNAAVEAARAGEHGKGFAVVAGEVRSLAARSQEAAKQTTTLIENSVEKVQDGYSIAKTTSASLTNILNQIDDISNLVNLCADESNKQKISIEKISGAISQISTVTQNNTATSEECAAASEELSNQADIFYTSVNDFKLKNS